ncbi:GNAT family N-acetyltransferase [bacterium]|nr:GNAT family N-acetyltransferase [bacterium]
MLSDPHETIFAREMLTSFVTRGNLVVSELTAGEQTAAVAINLKMGDWLYAFKIGWNDEFASASPGMLHELELVEAVRREMPEIRWIDSCAYADSYLSGIWPDRLVMGEGLLSVTTLARGTGKLMANVRKLKHWAAERIRQETPEEEVPAVN